MTSTSTTHTATLCDACTHVALGGFYADEVESMMGTEYADAKRAALASMGDIVGGDGSDWHEGRKGDACTACGITGAPGYTTFYYVPTATVATPRTPRYVQVNIGRNVGAEPMSAEDWDTFQDDAAMAIVNATAGSLPNVSVHTGLGYWNDARTGELLSEESAYLSTFADVDLFALRAELAKIKRIYRQDAIALIVGSDLI